MIPKKQWLTKVYHSCCGVGNFFFFFYNKSKMMHILYLSQCKGAITGMVMLLILFEVKYVMANVHRPDHVFIHIVLMVLQYSLDASIPCLVMQNSVH